jgi:hypothetical protein
MAAITRKTNDNRGPTRYNSNRPGASRPATYGHSSRAKAKNAAPRRIPIAGTEVITMTPAEYDTAVEALAVLIAAYWQQHAGPDSAPAAVP